MKKLLNQTKKGIFIGFFLILTGCGPVITEFHMKNSNGEMELIGKIHQTDQGMAKYQLKDGTVIEVDTRKMNFWQENIVPIFQKVIDTGQTAAKSAAAL